MRSMISKSRRFEARWSILLVLMLLIVTGLTSYRCLAKANDDLPFYGSEPLKWVPASAETVILTRGPFRLDSSEEPHEGQSLSRILQSKCLGPISWGENWFHETVGGKTLLLSLEIRLNFAKKTNLPIEVLKHSTPYDSIHLLVFSQKQLKNWNGLMEKLHSHSNEWTSTGDKKRLRITYDSRIHVMPDFFILSPRPGILMYATDKALLDDFARDMTAAEIETLLSCKNPIFGNEKWIGIRRYQQKDSDAASPLSANTCWPDSTAIGFLMKLKTANSVEWTYFSKNSERAAKFKLVDKYIASSEKKGNSSVYLLSDSKHRSADLWIVLMELLGPSFAP